MTSEKIKKIAKKIGFDLVGITSADSINPASEAYSKWLSLGLHAGMDYMSKNTKRRLNPKEIMPNAKSIICLAVNYYNGEKNGEKNCKIGKVAQYARGKNYHKVIENMLKKFEKEVYSFSNNDELSLKSYVDYGPFLERAYAMKAGLGFIGRNKNLITKEFGSWVFLSSVITNIEFEIDEPGKFGCGTCRACIDSCPTNAIIKEGEDPWGRETYIDSNKCLSYNTIENREKTIKKNVSGKARNIIFGCDICQEVCPWNREPKITKHKEFLEESGPGAYIDPQTILNLKDEDSFKEKYQGTSIIRAKFEGMKRNAKFVIENGKDVE